MINVSVLESVRISSIKEEQLIDEIHDDDDDDDQDTETKKMRSDQDESEHRVVVLNAAVLSGED